MIYHSFSFNNLSAPQLLPHLTHFIEQSTQLHQKRLPWHVCWLNNEGEPVIGLLPKTSWTVYKSCADNSKCADASSFNIEIFKTTRQVLPSEIAKNTQSSCQHSAPETDSKTDSISHLVNVSCTNYAVDYERWIKELIDYCKTKAEQQQKITPDSIGHTKLTSPSFYSGLMGFIGYDIGAKALAAHSTIELANQPAAFLGHYDIYLKPLANQGWGLYTEQDTPKPVKDMVVYYLQQLEQSLLDLLQQSTPPPALPLTALWDFEQYTEAFYKTQQYLYQGDSYQINLTQKWQGKLATGPSENNCLNQDKLDQTQPNQAHYQLQAPNLLDYLPDLYQKTKAPFAGFLGLTEQSAAADTSRDKQFELLSCSPELFVLFDNNEQGQPQIITKPIKGTLPRGVTAEQDKQLKQRLAMSEKDKAENVMIVDLLRNDLGRYAEVGSVKVPKLFAIESFSNVHHMVSTVQATIKAEHHPLTVLFNSLPAGSITGTPKKRAVEIISELEAAARGAYCGTLGYMNFDGTGQWNVLIRSLQADAQGQVALWAGGGITVGSACAAEYQECHDKVGNLVAILNSKQTGDDG